MYSYAYAPKTLKEQEFVVCNNPEIFNSYYIQEAEEMEHLIVFYYDKSTHSMDIIKSYDYQKCVSPQYFINNNIYDLLHTDTSYNQLKKIYPALKIPQQKIKY